MKILLKSLLIMFFFNISYAQTTYDKQSRKLIKKAQKNELKGKYHKSLEYLEAALKSNPELDDVWYYYSQLTLKEYQKESSNNLFANMMINVTVEGEDTEASEALAKSLMSIQNYPENNYKSRLMLANESSLNEKASAGLRALMIDKLYYNDSSISEKSMKSFGIAEHYFWKKDYEQAAEHYQVAIDMDPANYKAHLYLGDSYYFMQDYEKAAEVFSGAIEAYPNLIEPRKYLADALYKEGRVKKSVVALKESLLVFPDEGMYFKLIHSLDDLNKEELNRNWIPRTAPTASKTILIERKYFYDDQGYFKSYQESFEKNQENYDEDGILLESSSNKKLNRYMEIQCWEDMLKEHQDETDLEYARSMQEKGKLANYVFINLFQPQFYNQYLDYVSLNKTELIKYIEEELVVPK